MQKKCICIKPWEDYNIDDETFYMIGNRGTWFLGGSIISPLEFKEHFKPIEVGFTGQIKTELKSK